MIKQLLVIKHYWQKSSAVIEVCITGG